MCALDTRTAHTLYCIAHAHMLCSRGYIILTSFPIDSPLGAYPRGRPSVRPCVASPRRRVVLLNLSLLSASASASPPQVPLALPEPAAAAQPASALECLRPRPRVLRAYPRSLLRSLLAHFMFVQFGKKRFVLVCAPARGAMPTVGRRPAPSPVLSIRILSRN